VESAAAVSARSALHLDEEFAKPSPARALSYDVGGLVSLVVVAVQITLALATKGLAAATRLVSKRERRNW
jgi:hypothetical protein